MFKNDYILPKKYSCLCIAQKVIFSWVYKSFTVGLLYCKFIIGHFVKI